VKLLIAVWVAPQEPYPELYANGPRKTWMLDLPPDVKVIAVSGKKLSKVRKIFSDLNDQLRFAGPGKNDVGTVDYASFPQKSLQVILRKVHAGNVGIASAASNRVLRGLIRVASLAIAGWGQSIASWRKNRLRRNFVFRDNHLLFDRPATMANLTVITLDFLNWFLKQTDFAGVLFTTTGAYVRADALQSFVKNLNDDVDMATSSALSGEEEFFISGFAVYITRKGARKILESGGFDHSLLNDVALTKWVKQNDCELVRLPVLWQTNPEFERYIGTELSRSGYAVVRCTDHWDRSSETRLMHRLHSNLHSTGTQNVDISGT